MQSRAILIFSLIIVAGCRFNVDRALGPGEIRGTVVFDLGGGKTAAAPGAHVVLENSTVQVTADGRGRFVISSLPPGMYALSISASQAGNGKIDKGSTVTKAYVPTQLSLHSPVFSDLRA
jgi:hypothetical protein